MEVYPKLSAATGYVVFPLHPLTTTRYHHITIFQITSLTLPLQLLTGKIFLWLDAPGSITTGSNLTRHEPTPKISVTTAFTADATGLNETLTYTVDVARTLSLKSHVRTSSGAFDATWSQSLTYSNYGDLTAYGDDQINVQSTIGSDSAANVAGYSYARQISYPLTVNSTYTTDPSGNYSITANLLRGQDISIAGSPVFPTGLQSFEALPAALAGYPAFQGSALVTTQNGSAVYSADPNAGTATSFGTTAQDMVFSGIEVDASSGVGFPGVRGSEELYHRYVKAANGTVVQNEETLVGRAFGGWAWGPGFRVAPAQQAHVAIGSQRKVLGRGKGGNGNAD